MLYKLTDQKGQSFRGTQWGENVTHQAEGKGKGLCSEAVIHCYRHPLLAVLLNPIHANFMEPLLWEARGRIVVDDGLKVGCKRVTTIRQIPIPEITIEQRVKFAILVSLEVYTDEDYRKWAQGWLDNTDRAEAAAARAAARAAEAAARAAESADRVARAAAEAAARVARAAWAAESADRVAWAAAEAAARVARAAWAAAAADRAAWAAADRAAEAAESADRAAESADRVARAAAEAAAAAAEAAGKKIDFIKIAKTVTS